MISPTCPIQARLDALLHELRHNWIYYSGLPDDEEADADLFASMAGSIFTELEKQGGTMAVAAMNMRPAERFDLATFQRTLADFPDTPLICCAKCQQRIAPGSVVVSSPHADQKTSAMVVDMAFYCGGCDHVQTWREFATMSGRPTGAWAGKVEYLRGDAAWEFCAAHPDQSHVFEAA